MDVIKFSEVRSGDTIEVEDNGVETSGTVTYATPAPSGNFIYLGVRVGHLVYGYDHDADDVVVLLDREED